jgi:phospholipid-binding lipoprotein MlaA
VFNRFLEPFYWYDYGNERWISLAVSLVDLRARLLPLDATLQRTYDPYAFVRDAYSQRRLFQVYDGDVPEELLQEEDAFDDEFEGELEGVVEDEPADPVQPD